MISRQFPSCSWKKCGLSLFNLLFSLSKLTWTDLRHPCENEVIFRRTTLVVLQYNYSYTIQSVGLIVIVLNQDCFSCRWKWGNRMLIALKEGRRYGLRGGVNNPLVIQLESWWVLSVVSIRPQAVQARSTYEIAWGLVIQDYNETYWLFQWHRRIVRFVNEIRNWRRVPVNCRLLWHSCWIGTVSPNVGSRNSRWWFPSFRNKGRLYREPAVQSEGPSGHKSNAKSKSEFFSKPIPPLRRTWSGSLFPKTNSNCRARVQHRWNLVGNLASRAN